MYKRDWPETLKWSALLLMSLPLALLGTAGVITLICQIFVWNVFAVFPATFCAGVVYFLWWFVIDSLIQIKDATEYVRGRLDYHW